MKLNTDKIKKELKRIDKSKGWLAKKLKVSNATVSYIFKSRSITHAERVAKALNLDPKDLLI